jgi:predicted HTH transcriptional regulator
MELKDLIKEGEHLNQDFKFRIDDQRKIAKTLCAFANTDGGRLLIGVKDNGKVAGIDPEEEYHMIDGAANMYCSPPVVFSSTVWQEDHKLVLEVKVDKSESMPHYALDEDNKWKSYIRVQDNTCLVGKIQLRVWKEKNRVTSKPEKLGEEELNLLKLIQDTPNCTLSKLYRTSGLNMKKVDHLLVLFICWEIVEMTYVDEQTFYHCS